MKRQPAEKWSQLETDKFYLALQIFGTDFMMIERVFEGERSREQIKNKFRKEERKNKSHIDRLLANKEGLTLKDFSAKYGSLKFQQKKTENDKEANENDEGDESSSLDMMSSSDSSSDEDDSLKSESSSNETPIKKNGSQNKPKNLPLFGNMKPNLFSGVNKPVLGFPGQKTFGVAQTIQQQPII